MDIGDRLRTIRNQQSMTAKQLSELSGVPEKTIYRIETGEVKDPKLSSIEPLIRALNCSADELLFDPDQFTGLESLRRAFAYASKLPEPEQEMITMMINKVSLATNFERQISEQMQDAKPI